MNRSKVVLVNKKDKAIGEMDKMEAHIKGVLHRAFSVFIFNDKNEMLLQQRAIHKYHGGGLWTNACCSHPQWKEDVLVSAKERLEFEMGLQCNLKYLFSFIYEAEVENNLTEHEYDYVFIGYAEENPNPNIEEVQNYKWMSVDTILEDIKSSPSKYTYWFKTALPELLESMKNKMTTEWAKYS